MEREEGGRGCMERGIERERGRGRGRGKEEKWPCRGAGIVVKHKVVPHWSVFQTSPW